ncbi:hypothetical protein ACIBF1_38590 [Spirillospora sp. NPDC050679]
MKPRRMLVAGAAALAALATALPVHASPAVPAAVLAAAPTQPPSLARFALKGGQDNIANGTLAALTQAVAQANGGTGEGEFTTIIDNAPKVQDTDCGGEAEVPADATVYCFTQADFEHERWTPQGISGIADAAGTEQWGGRKALLVSWYDDAAKDTGQGPTHGVRVSVFNTATGKYDHVLLVEPVKEGGEQAYKTVPIHAGGIVWYGDHLYLADTRRGVRVFNLKHIVDLGTRSVQQPSKFGLMDDGRYYGYGHRYVIPQASSWFHETGALANGAQYSCVGDQGPPKTSYLAVDRTQDPDVLVSGEYCRKPQADELPHPDQSTNGRMATWPLDETWAEPFADTGGVIRANHAAWLRLARVQGVAGSYGAWFFSQSNGTSNPGKMFRRAWVDGVTWTNLTPANTPLGIGPEALHCWGGQGRIWTVSEHVLMRAVYGVPEPMCKK